MKFISFLQIRKGVFLIENNTFEEDIKNFLLQNHSKKMNFIEKEKYDKKSLLKGKGLILFLSYVFKYLKFHLQWFKNQTENNPIKINVQNCSNKLSSLKNLEQRDKRLSYSVKKFASQILDLPFVDKVQKQSIIEEKKKKEINFTMPVLINKKLNNVNDVQFQKPNQKKTNKEVQIVANLSKSKKFQSIEMQDFLDIMKDQRRSTKSRESFLKNILSKGQINQRNSNFLLNNLLKENSSIEQLDKEQLLNDFIKENYDEQL